MSCACDSIRFTLTRRNQTATGSYDSYGRAVPTVGPMSVNEVVFSELRQLDQRVKAVFNQTTRRKGETHPPSWISADTLDLFHSLLVEQQ